MALPRRTTGSLDPAFAPARLVCLAVNPAYALALHGGFPIRLSRALGASVTFWEATAPVKLPALLCSSPGSREEVRFTALAGWYLTGGSAKSENLASKPPTYPAQQEP